MSFKKYIKKFTLVINDIMIFNISFLLASYLFSDPISLDKTNISTMALLTFVSTIILFLFKTYEISWKFGAVREFTSVYIASMISIVLNTYVLKFLSYPIDVGVSITWWLIFIIGLFTSRGLYKITNIYMLRYKENKSGVSKRVMIVGAGSCGNTIVREMFMNSSLGTAIIAIDDNIAKQHTRLNGVLVAGNTNAIPRLANKYDIDEIIIAIAIQNKQSIKRIVEICARTRCKIKIIPSVTELLFDKFTTTQAKDINIVDLLGREEISLNTNQISEYIRNQTVLVTGGGGSIGSELCRQIAKHNPKLLIVFDIYENNAYDLQNELKSIYGSSLELLVLIGSVRDMTRVKEVFSRYKPNIIFHAAAHKHVPLMEDSPNEAIKNNVLGTRNVAKCADKYGAKRFVLISTDKAVNPTNIMGASKRLAEVVMQDLSKYSNTKFAAVRFGNVLGSNGSVIPIFKKQIENGGPVKVTHPDIIRYFMSIPEAAQLVLQAGSLAEGGEIFILDMGNPVKIVDLAKDLIRLSGYEPDIDIKIEFTGLRPGEKMYEELLLDKSIHKSTNNNKIYIEPPILEDFKIEDEIKKLKTNLSCNCEMLDELTQHLVSSSNRIKVIKMHDNENSKISG